MSSLLGGECSRLRPSRSREHSRSGRHRNPERRVDLARRAALALGRDTGHEGKDDRGPYQPRRAPAPPRATKSPPPLEQGRLRDAERHARTRRLIEAGGLIDKAGLLDLDANALYGALLSLRDGADDRARSSSWRTRWAAEPSPMRRACATKARNRSS